jgi:hypothetical protein
MRGLAICIFTQFSLIRSRKMRLAGHVERRVATRNASTYNIMVEKLQGKRSLRRRAQMEDEIKTNLKRNRI